MKRMTTSKIAAMANCHPNTVRLYEEIGYLPPVPRLANGYRVYTLDHADQMVLARRGLDGDYTGRQIRESIKEMVLTAASGNLTEALEHANRHLELAVNELAQARMTIAQVEEWVNQAPPSLPEKTYHTTPAARLLDVTVDSLRTWERNDLLRVQRDPSNGYRLYGPKEILRLRIIRMLRMAGYSLMAIYRMLKKLDEGQTRGLEKFLDTPGEEEDFFGAADRWITALTREEQKGKDLIALLEDRIRRKNQTIG